MADSELHSDETPSPGDVLAELMAVIESRRDHPPEKSYTNTLLQGGVPKIGAKVMEEAGETVEAAEQVAQATAANQASVQEHVNHVVYEAGDLIYHLFVLLAFHNIPLSQLTNELARRFGMSGLDEKAARSKDREA